MAGNHFNSTASETGNPPRRLCGQAADARHEDNSMHRIILGAMAAALLTMGAGSLAGEPTENRGKDDDTTMSVKAALINSARTHARDIHVTTWNGIVQLSGFVRSDAERSAAAGLAADVPGVKKVVNSLAIGSEGSFGQSMGDSVTTGQVKAALMNSARVKSLEIEVETLNGTVQLSGFVDTQEAREAAGEIAATVDGVAHVDNVLQLKSP
jgi:hyperosmotically inducible protein